QRIINDSDRKNALRVTHQNIRYISNKVDAFDIFVNDLLSDVVIITEHGLGKDEINLCSLTNYKFVDEFSRSIHKGGGVA
ncbi:hypothetical protein, partial [Streptococcus anginosus]|uniref:hypothetical protein n=1 Tax=Streptococcus anginosus TaxID=1328 RepID=UPI002EDB0EA8